MFRAIRATMRTAFLLSLLALAAHASTAMAQRGGGNTPARRAARGAVRGAVAPADLHPYAPGIDVQHYDVWLRVDGEGRAIRAVATLSVQRASSADSLRLDLLDLDVDTLMVDGRLRAFTRDSASVRFALQPGDGTRFRVTVNYHGQPKDGLIIRQDSTRGWSAFGDNWPNRARHWIPSVDHPSDKATVNWTVTAPASLDVVANGRMVQRELLPVRYGETPLATTRFTLSQPIPTYLMVVGIAELREHRLGRTACGAAERGGCVDQSVWTFPQEAFNMPGNFAEAGRIVETFAQWFGPYAYPQLHHVQSATRFGGMENATAIFYSDNAFRTNKVGVGLIAHETAHQWFGDAVTPRRWQDLWLSEGFATYLDALYTQRTRGDSAYRETMQRIRETVLAAPVVATRPVVDTVGALAPLTLLNANSYQKGGFVLHMLRAEIGDSAFFVALREYQREFHNGTATTADFQRHAEQASGRSLAAFFTQWLHRPGFADVTITWTWKASTSSLVMQVAQGTRFAPFAAPLTLQVRTADGRTVRVQANLAAQASQQIVIPVSGVTDVSSLEADPDVGLLGRVTLLQAMP